jgi:hypothetical protein
VLNPRRMEHEVEAFKNARIIQSSPSTDCDRSSRRTCSAAEAGRRSHIEGAGQN